MNFVQMLMQAPNIPSVAPRAKRKVLGGAARKLQSQGRFRLIMEGQVPMSTGEIALKRGITHTGCLSCLYQLEKDGLVRQAGTRPSNGNRHTTLWVWCEYDD